MNTLVEKMFGIIMFLAIFVPFQLGLYASYMSAWEFTQVTTEFTQLVKEEGGYKTGGRVDKFYGKSGMSTPKDLYDLGYRITFSTPKLDATGKVVYEDKSVPKDGIKESIVYDTVAKDAPLKVGQVIQIKYTKDSPNAAYGWNPKLEKITNVTVYKR